MLVKYYSIVGELILKPRFSLNTKIVAGEEKVSEILLAFNTSAKKIRNIFQEHWFKCAGLLSKGDILKAKELKFKLLCYFVMVGNGWEESGDAYDIADELKINFDDLKKLIQKDNSQEIRNWLELFKDIDEDAESTILQFYYINYYIQQHQEELALEAAQALAARKNAQAKQSEYAGASSKNRFNIKNIIDSIIGLGDFGAARSRWRRPGDRP